MTRAGLKNTADSIGAAGPGVAATYTMRGIEAMLGLGRSVITRLIHAGFVSPMRGRRNEYRFTFQDVVLLRTAHHLKRAHIGPRRLLRSLRQLRSRLPDEVPLSGLRIQAIGNEVVVREGPGQWEAQSGQLLMDFEVAAAAQGSIAFLSPAMSAPPTAVDWFSRGEQLEAEDTDAAEHAYRQAIALAPDDANAYLNLGAMLCETRRCDEAVALFELGMRRCPREALLAFNLAVALEDQHKPIEAIASYERALALAPDLADAHFNAARLYREQGEPQRALRHYSAYRRLQEPR